ncbi:MAG: bifunctional diguanylate cyclase/phosphodiesterase [Chloracidobacterium sp.]|nr:bifunctional diguanylate cyclase/phosphodiesterase [Chloracidobacterium sp.]
MNREAISKYAKHTIVLIGAICFATALADLPLIAVSWGFLLVIAFSTIVAPRMSLELPRSRFAISFSDAAVFLAFLYYGGPAAIVVAALENLASCLYLRSKGFTISRLMILTNVAINSISISFTYLAWLYIPKLPFVSVVAGTTPHLVSTLGCLAIMQFATSSVLAAIVRSTSDGSSLWVTWKRDCFSSSMTQMVGAGLAGIVYKLIHFGDLLTGLIAFTALTIAYFGYRQSINKVGEAMHQAESAEREKAEVERERRREAEKHASQLTLSLEKEELANEALRKSEKDLQHAALYDSLTDLPNRKQFGDILRKLIDRYKNDPKATFQILFLDIRKFKNINDSLGHTLGDKVLMVAAKRFVRMVNSADMVARIGGDEFAIILKDLGTSGKAQKVARRIFDSIAQPFSLSGNRISLSVNVGIAPCDAEYSTPEEILRDADIAMHYAKEKNSGVAVFTKDLRERFLERVRYENDLRSAIDRNELTMHYQPLVDLQSGGLFGFEALLRWHHNEFGQIPPNKFIPIAEESGLIIPITKWILESTCKQLAAWQKIDPSYRDLIVSVNISGKHLSNDDLIDDVENALAISKIDPASLKLEITESAAMENAEHTISVLNRLKALGVQLSIDDFGTGYSSLSYLHRLPFDTLKIDRSFVIAVGENGEDSEILQTIISLAKNLKKKVIAEGIETEAQLALLQNLGCDYGQGYLLSRPQTRDKAEAALYDHRNWLPSLQNSVTDVTNSVPDNIPAF